MGKYQKLKTLNLALQQLYVKRLYPGWTSNIKQSVLICVGNIQPSELSQIYTVELSYMLNKSPKIMVTNPTLENDKEGKKPPHLYNDNSLCLYHPKSCEWDSSKIIATTILPWTSLWLYYYEIWLATGEWKRGGIHLPRKKASK